MIERLGGRRWKVKATGEVFNDRADAEKAKLAFLAKKYAREQEAPKKTAPRRKAPANGPQA